MRRAVRFMQYGGIAVLVAVRAAGINPGKVSIRQGRLHNVWPARFPSGQGSDVAGTVVAVGERARTFSVGDEVLGFTDDRASQADCVVTDEAHLTHKPAGVPWAEAGALKVAGATTRAAVRAVDVHEDDVVVISAAAGSIGSLTTQLAYLRGAQPDQHDRRLPHGREARRARGR